MDLYEKYRLTRTINACGKMTHLAGAIVLPEVVEEVTEAMGCFFNLEELQERAGEIIARATGAEWGCVTACTAAGIALGVAGAMTGRDIGKVWQLPDTNGMKNEVVIQKGQCVNFGAPVTQMIRMSGASVVEVGTVHNTTESHLKHAIGENTAAVVCVVSHHTVRYGCVPLEKLVAIAHERNVPVIVDGAAQSFVIKKIVDTGADLIICSGHKYLSGTTAGVVCGKRELVEALNLQNRGIGRPMKVGKEGIVGVMGALDYRMKLDVLGWEAEQDRKMNRIVERLEGIDGISLSVDPDPNGNPFSRARVSVDPDRAGLNAEVINRAMMDDEPSIRLRAHHTDEGYFTVDAMELTEEEIELTCDRLVGMLTATDAVKAGIMEKFGAEDLVDARWAWLR
jgi:L-seryl-tRNA(Ser) seleniumtransferase